MSGRLHGVSRIYTTSASVSEVMDALKEASDAIRTFPGLARYTVVKLTDGRVGIFNSFDSQANARKSSEEAKSLRAKSGTLIARVLPSDPQKLAVRWSEFIRANSMSSCGIICLSWR